jgi:hypothetical protein
MLHQDPMRWVAVALLLVPCVAAADGRLLDDDTFAVGPHGDLAIDADLLVGMPAALPTGIATGFAAGITRGCGCRLAYGVRASWSATTESSQAWTVSQADYRLRATGAIRATAGRGTFALRLGLGTTIVREQRVRTFSMESSSTIETHALSALPAADLEAVVALHIAGPWLGVLSAGPSVDVHDGGIHGGWTAALGVAWQP